MPDHSMSLRVDALPETSLTLTPRELTVITDALTHVNLSKHVPADVRNDSLSLLVRLNDWADNMGVPIEEGQ